MTETAHIDTGGGDHTPPPTPSWYAAAQTVLRSIAETSDPDRFWENVGVTDPDIEFPAAVEQWAAGEIDGVRYYPRGILAYHALGQSVSHVDIFHARERAAKTG
jgi:hypothetical protein